MLQASWSVFIHKRSYLWLPALISGAWAWRTRRFLIVWGHLAFVPWLALQFLAKENVMGTLSWYYAFPTMTALAWPLVAMRMAGPAINRQTARHTMWWIALMLISTLAGQGNGRNMIYAWQMGQQLSLSPSAIQADEAFMQTLDAHLSDLGKLRVDNGVIALRPRTFKADQRAEVVGIEDKG